MKTKTINLYSFDELSEDAQQKAIENLYDINISHDWWDITYDDAERIGLKITGFDIDRGNYCNGEFIFPSVQIAETIIKEHGENCESYKTAQNFLSEYKEALKNFDTANSEDESGDLDFHDTMEFEDLADEFKRSLLEDYRIILSKEYDYLTSKEQIIECIKSNDYTFTEDGTLE